MALSQGHAAFARAGGERSPANAFQRGVMVMLAVCLLGLGVGALLLRQDLQASGDIAAALYRGQDVWWFAIVIVAILYLRGQMDHPPAPAMARMIERYWPSEPRIVRHTGAIALAVLAIAGIGAYWAVHGFDLLPNEQAAAFQASILGNGDLLAELPADWAAFVGAMTPPGIAVDAEAGLWGAGRPMGHAALRAAFSAGGIEPLTAAALNGLSIILLVAVARRLWPDRGDIALVAAILMATTPQFLAAGMTGGAWSALLCCNLLWLLLYLRGGLLGHLSAALVGVAAAWMDQIPVHLAFVLPFLVAMLRNGRWRLVVLYGASYAAAGLVWIWWHDIALALSDGAVADAAAMPRAEGLPTLPATGGLIDAASANLAAVGTGILRFVAWQNPVILPLIYVAVRKRRSMPPEFRHLAWGCLLSFVLLFLSAESLGGWGILPFHGALGGLVLLATLGWSQLSGAPSAISATRGLAVLTLAVVVFGLPLRTAQMDALVRPMAVASQHLQSLTSDVVLVDLNRVPFGSALMQNDPYSTAGPMILALQRLTPEQVVRLCERYVVDFVDHYDLVRFGISPAPDGPGKRIGLSEHDRELRAIATSPRCNDG